MLSCCPHLRALSLTYNDEAVAYLASSEDLADRPLLLHGQSLPPGADDDTLTAAGHGVGNVLIGVHWRVAGGLMFDGRAVAGV